MYTLFFLLLLKNIDCGYSLEPPRRGGYIEYHNLCFEQKYKKHQSFLFENFPFWVVKFSVYLNMCVFVMFVATTDFEKMDYEVFWRTEWETCLGD